MNVSQTITATEMRGINRSAILDLIRREGPIARTAISKQLGVSLPTVMRIIDELEVESLVRETGMRERSGGRRRALLELNASQHLTLGVDLGGTKMYGAVADLAGQFLSERTVPHHGTNGESAYQRLVTLLEDLREEAQKTGRHIRGIGVGAPGVTDPANGVVRWAPSLSWRDFPLRRRLENHFNLPVIVENDVNLSAQGELWFGAGQDVPNLVLITIGTGIGAGVIIDHMLHRGAHLAAGEIGYLIPRPELLGECYQGFGCLESLASGSGIAARARQALKALREPAALEQLTAEDVFQAARNGEAWSEPVIRETVDMLAQAVAAVSTCFDPDVIIFGGGVARSADLLIEPILTRLEGALPVRPNLVASRLGHRAAVLGAVMHLLHTTADFFVVRRLS